MVEKLVVIHHEMVLTFLLSKEIITLLKLEKKEVKVCVQIPL